MFNFLIVSNDDSQSVKRLGYRLDGPRFNHGRNKRYFSYLKRAHWLWIPPSLLFNTYRGSSPEVKTREPEVDRSLALSAEAEELMELSSPGMI
jgi:hypothetical protein